MMVNPLCRMLGVLTSRRHVTAFLTSLAHFNLAVYHHCILNTNYAMCTLLAACVTCMSTES